MRLEKLGLATAIVLAIVLAAGFQAGVLTGPASALLGSAAGLDPPTLDDPAMIRRGAAHYDRVCARCHGSPARPAQSSALDLSPSPPKLHERIEHWPPEMLFDVVMNGVAGTGMPAWPARDRHDEVWDMVAFLKVLPELDAPGYSGLATLPLPGNSGPVALCMRCHGADGRGAPDGAFPRLDIQASEYLYDTLQAFSDGHRSSGFMASALDGLTDDELRIAAQYFGRSTPVPIEAPRPALPTSTTPACDACHGRPESSRLAYPRLAGQYQGYLEAQYRMLSDREHPRGGGPHVSTMHQAARLSTELGAQQWLAWYGQP